MLGLVKAQQVKNAIIVPVGAKGAFVPKRMPMGADRETVQREGVACYKLFVSTLLDVTDNLIDNELVAPPQMLARDGEDPYLVVAADKGTASFSDTANAIALDRDFWLGDAFASGGSVGYDHKKMGITARGGWEAVKRHFRELDRDIQTQPFTAVGVGDMSGDVFGNGMLLSPQLHLIAAFDHRDIFIDPDPDALVAETAGVSFGFTAGKPPEYVESASTPSFFTVNAEASITRALLARIVPVHVSVFGPSVIVMSVIEFVVAVIVPDELAPNAGLPKLRVATAVPGAPAVPVRRNTSFAAVLSVESTRSATVSRKAVG